MNERCKVCGGVLNQLYDCIECGQCALCWPNDCECAYEEIEEEEEEENMGCVVEEDFEAWAKKYLYDW